MKRQLIIIPILVMIISCGKSKKEEQKEKVKDGEEKIAQMNDIVETLETDHDVTFNQDLDGPLVSMNESHMVKKAQGYGQEECQQIKQSLRNYITLGDEVLTVVNADNVYYSDKPALEKSVKSAKSLISRINCLALIEDLELKDKAAQEEAFKKAENKLSHFANIHFKLEQSDDEYKLIIKHQAADKTTSSDIDKVVSYLKEFINTTDQFNGSQLAASLFIEEKKELVRSLIIEFQFSKLIREISVAMYSNSETSTEKDKVTLLKINTALDILKQTPSVADDIEQRSSTIIFLGKYKERLLEGIKDSEILSAEALSEVITISNDQTI